MHEVHLTTQTRSLFGHPLAIGGALAVESDVL